jgi:rubrerythrin
MTIFEDYTIEELEGMLQELRSMKVEAEKDLAKVMSPDYDPETDYEGEEEKQSSIEFDIRCERENIAGIDKDIRIIESRISNRKNLIFVCPFCKKSSNAQGYQYKKGEGIYYYTEILCPHCGSNVEQRYIKTPSGFLPVGEPNKGE